MSDVAVWKRIFTKVDGWKNVFGGFGTKQDRAKSTRHEGGRYLSDDELEGLYSDEGLATRIVDVVADDMTRTWINLDIDDDKTTDKDNENRKELNMFLDRIHCQAKFNEAIKWARLYRGAVVYMGIVDGQTPDKPLNPKSIKEFGPMRVISAPEIDIGMTKYQTDPTKPGYGDPVVLYCQVFVVETSNYIPIHVSRLIFFRGKRVPIGVTRSDQQRRMWGVSILQAVNEALKKYGIAHQAAINLLFDVAIGKWKLANLAEMLSEGHEKELLARMEIIDLQKSMLRGVFLDASQDEDYVRDQLNLSGLEKILERFEYVVCGVSGIPQTRLFGTTPAGLSPNDNTGLTTYYDMVDAQRETDLAPAIQQIIDIWRIWQKVPEEMTWDFNELQRLTDKESAEIRKFDAETEKLKAETNKTYIDAGVVTADEVRVLVYGDELDDLQSPLPSPGEESATEATQGAVK